MTETRHWIIEQAVLEYEAGRLSLRDVSGFARGLARSAVFVNPNRKGKRYETEVAHAIEDVLGGSARRVPNSGGLDIKGDLRCFGNVLADWHLECKRQERVTIWKWLDQACGQAASRRWALVFRRNDRQSHVALPLVDFLNVLGEVQELRERLAMVQEGASDE